MCPSATSLLSDLDLHCNNADIIICLFKLQQGLSPLPSNVTTHTNPYCNRPENLSDKKWFLIDSEGSKIIEGGVWKSKGDPCPVFIDNAINGWRTTFEFFEEKTPRYWQKTGWMMQEFKITPCELGQSIHDINVHGSVLCRVFQSGGNLTDQDVGLKYSDDDSAVEKSFHPIPLALLNTDSPFEKGSTSNHQENYQCEQGILECPPTAPVPTDPAAKELWKNDFISRGDYLELGDLETPGSPSSISENSSCMTISSDECFDRLHELEPREGRDSRCINVPPHNSSGALIVNGPRSLFPQGTRRTDLPSTSSADKSKEKKGECSHQNPSPNHPEACPSSPDSEGDKKGHRRVKRRRNKYWCFSFSSYCDKACRYTRPSRGGVLGAAGHLDR
ncbi:hypothetical protein SAY86_027895 [Trapa natans]|uniref:NAC domain-containing protein n=1 Tax=Trapa natans TaxID=22666 RepID=A0AAN7M1G3_TRANT|nr:hypothetical protein SAY86_027895 [Trapa natans]